MTYHLNIFITGLDVVVVDNKGKGLYSSSKESILLFVDDFVEILFDLGDFILVIPIELQTSNFSIKGL